MDEYDYKRKDFKEIKEANGNKKYHIKVNGKYIEVTKDVFYVYKNEYKRIRYRQKLKGKNPTYNYKNNDKSYPVDELFHKEMIDKMMTILSYLNEENYQIIHALFFEEIPAASLAKQLGISKQSLNYRKKKILLFLRKLL